MKIPAIAFCCLSLIPISLHAQLLVHPNDFVAICGDSITYQQQYSAFIEDYLLMCQPVRGVQVDQFGYCGEKTGGFVERLSREVLPFIPTVVTLCYGMNDGGMNEPNFDPENPLILDTFRKGETDAIHALKAAGVRTIVVGSPGCVDSRYFHQNGIRPDVYNGTLQKVTDVAREVAKSEGLPFAEIHSLMTSVMTQAKAAYGDTYPIAGDGIHPASNGHIVMAYAFLKAMGCDGAIGTITVDLQMGTAKATPEHKVLSVRNGSVEIESSRYPFCFSGAPADANATSGTIKFFPFNKDLNRYILVVKGLNTPKAKITWGSESKDFSATDLAKGINLAEEFINNPFAAKFAEVDKAVRVQQSKEDMLVNMLMRNAGAIKGLAPKQTDAVDRVLAEAVKQDGEQAKAAAALVTPVRHTITIEAIH
jgi:lysophospholipase L1-like esterase